MSGDDNPIFQLFWTFALISLFAIGGAVAAIPELHRVAVDVRHWMTDKQFADAFDTEVMLTLLPGSVLRNGGPPRHAKCVLHGARDVPYLDLPTTDRRETPAPCCGVRSGTTRRNRHSAGWDRRRP